MSEASCESLSFNGIFFKNSLSCASQPDGCGQVKQHYDAKLVSGTFSHLRRRRRHNFPGNRLKAHQAQ